MAVIHVGSHGKESPVKALRWYLCECLLDHKLTWFYCLKFCLWLEVKCFSFMRTVKFLDWELMEPWDMRWTLSCHLKHCKIIVLPRIVLLILKLMRLILILYFVLGIWVATTYTIQFHISFQPTLQPCNFHSFMKLFYFVHRAPFFSLIVWFTKN